MCLYNQQNVVAECFLVDVAIRAKIVYYCRSNSSDSSSRSLNSTREKDANKIKSI
jgi:hypothetical protein